MEYSKNEEKNHSKTVDESRLFRIDYVSTHTTMSNTKSAFALHQNGYNLIGFLFILEEIKNFVQFSK